MHIDGSIGDDLEYNDSMPPGLKSSCYPLERRNMQNDHSSLRRDRDMTLSTQKCSWALCEVIPLIGRRDLGW